MSYFGTSALTPLDDNMFVSNALSRTPTFGESIGPLMERGVRQTYGLGTAIRAAEVYVPREASAEYRDGKPLTEDEWKASPHYRDGVQYSTGMTEGRAKRIAEARDADAVREWYAGQRPWTALLTGLAGGFADPINYIPVVSQFGQGAGLATRIGLSAADAALNTGAAAVATAKLRAQLGDDVSEGEVLRQMAYSAVAGAVLGGAFHLIGNRRAAFKAGQTQAAQSQSAIVLNNLADNEATGRTDIWPATRDAIEQINTMLREAQNRYDYKMEEFRVTAVDADGTMRVEAFDTPGIRVYHGSPHDFDRFSMEHIGKGEGAQAYGFGLYFAESPEVAGSYKQALERRNIAATWDGKPVESWPKLVSDLQNEDWRQAKIVDEMGRVGGDPTAFFKGQRDWYRGQQEMLAAVDVVEKRLAATHTPGAIYEARIKANPDDFLDWDKPLSEQPAGKRLLEQFGGKPEWTGAQFYESSKVVPGDYADKQAATARLREAGIPGIKYLDGNSRTAGEGSRNYVVFDDSLIEVTAKNGKPVRPPMDLTRPWDQPQWTQPVEGSNIDPAQFAKAEAAAMAPTKPTFNPVADLEVEAKDLGIDLETGRSDMDDWFTANKDALDPETVAGIEAELQARDTDVAATKAFAEVMEIARTCKA